MRRRTPPRPAPLPPAPVPVWIGGNTGVAMRRAVRNDGWIGSYIGLDRALEDVRTVRALRAGSEASEQPFSVSMTGPAVAVFEGEIEIEG